MTTWLDVAKGLEVGRSARIKHDCNPSGAPSLMVRHDLDCYRAYCFRCKEPGMYEAKRLSLADRLLLMQEQREADSVIDLHSKPEPREHNWLNWPDPAMQWLLKAGIGEADAVDLGIYYHPPTHRVVVPYNGTHHWQARAVMDGAKPKYLADKNTRECALQGPEVWRNSPAEVFLTEDLLSAYKVALAGRWSLPLMGTSLHDEHIAYLLQRTDRVAVWLDPDEAGQAAARKTVKRLQVYGLEVTNIQLDKDPKYYTRYEIAKLARSIEWH